MRNQVGKDCAIHKKYCNLFCIFSKCTNKIICEKCVPGHLEQHPRDFIYEMERLCEYHAFDKISRLKEVLGKNKVLNQKRILSIYNSFDDILTPLIQRSKQFEKQSKEMIIKELMSYLAKNKSIIESTTVNKSDTLRVKATPMQLIEETIAEVELINSKEEELKKNTLDFTWYADATEQLIAVAKQEINTMIKAVIKLLDVYTKIQHSRYTLTQETEAINKQTYFYKYLNTCEVSYDRQSLEMDLIQSKKEMNMKDLEVKRLQSEIKERDTRIVELHLKNSSLKQEINQLHLEAAREELELKEAVGREKLKLHEYLVKNDIVSDGAHSISVVKKAIEQKYFPIIFELVPRPIELQLSQHYLTREQLNQFQKCRSVQILKMNFMPCDKQFLCQALKNFEALHTLELNSTMLDNQTLQTISLSFSNKMKHIQLMDNKISDDGLEYMFRNMRCQLDSLYVSYNNLTARSIDIINMYSPELKVLHISRNPLKMKGAQSLGRCLRKLEELFIGDSGIPKQGFIIISRNCVNLKKLSLVKTDISTDIISELLFGLEKLKWMDLSYSNLNKEDLEKIDKLKILNEEVVIVSES